VRARVIVVNHVNSYTRLEERDVDVDDGVPVDPDLGPRPRHPARRAARLPSGRFEVCLVAGLGLSRGGWASSFAHDSHNVFVLGRSPAAMAAALRAVLDAGGGMAFAPGDGGPVAALPLPLAGLLSDEPIDAVAAGFDALERGLRDAGVGVLHPVLLLTLLPLTVSPDWKISDKGVVDVEGRRVLPALVAARA
jgi:adenine deaminase